MEREDMREMAELVIRVPSESRLARALLAEMAINDELLGRAQFTATVEQLLQLWIESHYGGPYQQPPNVGGRWFARWPGDSFQGFSTEEECRADQRRRVMLDDSSPVNKAIEKLKL